MRTGYQAAADVVSKLFRELEAVVDDTAILATNTSSLMNYSARGGVARSFIATSLFNPVPLMKLVGCPRLLTDAAVIDRLTAYVSNIGHASVLGRYARILVNHADGRSTRKDTHCQRRRASVSDVIVLRATPRLLPGPLTFRSCGPRRLVRALTDLPQFFEEDSGRILS
jgi:hypothetical protein